GRRGVAWRSGSSFFRERTHHAERAGYVGYAQLARAASVTQLAIELEVEVRAARHGERERLRAQHSYPWHAAVRSAEHAEQCGRDPVPGQRLDEARVEHAVVRKAVRADAQPAGDAAAVADRDDVRGAVHHVAGTVQAEGGRPEHAQGAQ